MLTTVLLILLAIIVLWVFIQFGLFMLGLRFVFWFLGAILNAFLGGKSSDNDKGSFGGGSFGGGGSSDDY